MRATSRGIHIAILAALGLTVAAGTLLTAGPSGGYSLAFDATRFTLRSFVLGERTISYRAYEGIVYVGKPVDLKYETLNFYVPLEYYQGKSLNGFDADSAPIFLPNTVGGYMPGAAGSPGLDFEGRPNAAMVALSKGLVVAEPGARGRTLKDAAGRYCGKAPAAIVDLKAAVRYLRLNDALMPGDAERIVSNGTSAGGALSALLGASGDSADYGPYLEALGAADARDDVFAVSAYCPITNLDNADSAYEWLLGGLTETKASQMGPPPAAMGEAGPAPAGGPADNPFGAPPSSAGPMSAQELAVSAQLRALFPAYLDSLGLTKADGSPLGLKEDGSGSFKDYLQACVLESANAAMAAGADLSQHSWLDLADGQARAIDWAGYIAYCGRKKGSPAFDALDLSSGENSLFGGPTIDSRHFTAFGLGHDSAKGGSADPSLVKLMNPMAYIGGAGARTSQHWRLRQGTLDSDTSIAIPAILAARLANTGRSVDFALPWDRPHSGDYDLEELFAWVGERCR